MGKPVLDRLRASASLEEAREAIFRDEWLPKLQARYPGGKFAYEYTDLGQHVITVRLEGRVIQGASKESMERAFGRLEPKRRAR